MGPARKLRDTIRLAASPMRARAASVAALSSQERVRIRVRPFTIGKVPKFSSPTAIFGAMGAAAGIGAALGLTQRQLVDALGKLATPAAGLGVATATPGSTACAATLGRARPRACARSSAGR